MLYHRTGYGKRESVSCELFILIATWDENRRAVGMLNPMRDQSESTYRGGEGMTPVKLVRVELESVNDDHKKTTGDIHQYMEEKTKETKK